MRTLALILLCLLQGLAAVARADALQPFHVQYRLYVSKIPTTIKADLWLRETDTPDQYQMELLVKSLLLSNREISTFSWNDCQPRTHHYAHQFRGFGKRRNYDMHFSWDPPQVVTSYDDKTREFSIEQDTLDDLTLLLKARCVLKKGDKEFNATSAYGRKIRQQNMQVIGREILDTPLGKIDCLVIEKKRDSDSERKTLFWLAPKLDYMLIRAKHIESRALFGELVMRDFERAPEDVDSDPPPSPENHEKVLASDDDEAADSGHRRQP